VTFADAGQSRLGWRRFARFLALWLLLTACSTLLVGVVGPCRLRWAWLAKPVVEAGLAVVSFLLWRHVVSVSLTMPARIAHPHPCARPGETTKTTPHEAGVSRMAQQRRVSA
jgi:hypothetical protein